VHTVLKINFTVYVLPERDYVTFESLLSQIRLSSVVRRTPVCLSVTLVTQGVEAFSNISSPLYTWPSCNILRISSQE